MTFHKELNSRLKELVSKKTKIDMYTEKGLFSGTLTDITDSLVTLSDCSLYLLQQYPDCSSNQKENIVLNFQDVIFVSY